jgi:hypothetical protein
VGTKDEFVEARSGVIVVFDDSAEWSKGLRPVLAELLWIAVTTVSENTERVVKNSGELSQIVLVFQREKPHSLRI